jgi:hypothetical protein
VTRRLFFPGMLLLALANAIDGTFLSTGPSPVTVSLWIAPMLALALWYSEAENRRLRIRAAAAHPGIRLRISNPGDQALLEGDSDMLHLMARFGHADADGWMESFRTSDGLVVEMKPVMLPNPAGEVL